MPDRATFSVKEYARPLKPYFALTAAVRRGSLADFNACVATHAAAFRADATYTLVVRLGHNVVKVRALFLVTTRRVWFAARCTIRCVNGAGNTTLSSMRGRRKMPCHIEGCSPVTARSH